MRPQMAEHYTDVDLAMQAALLVEGIAVAHPFVDGNKRTAAIAGILFLRVNGYGLVYQQFDVGSHEDDFGNHILQIVMHQITVETLADWMREHLETRP